MSELDILLAEVKLMQSRIVVQGALIERCALVLEQMEHRRAAMMRDVDGLAERVNRQTGDQDFF